MKYRHFFWDFDGTLYDTYGRVTRANEKAMADLGVTLEYDALYRAVKRSIFYAWELYAVPRGIDWDTYFAAYRRHADEEGPESMMPYPGTGEALAKIVALGGRNYLYTHRDNAAWDALRREGLDGLFADGVTSQNHFPSKPAPDALNYLVQKNGLTRAECLMIGDRDIDLEAGKNAGMDGALFDPEDFYADYPAALRFHSMGELAQALAKQ